MLHNKKLEIHVEKSRQIKTHSEKKVKYFKISKRNMNAENEKLLRGKLFAAAWRGEFDGVKTILEDGSNKIDIDSQDDNGVTTLRFTSKFGHYESTE